MIEANAPETWRALQDCVAQILRESGVAAEVEKTIQTVRGDVTVDVWAHDPGATPNQTYLIECKRWHTRVPQTVVHSFRTVVGDAGANWGAIISAKGFQKGAFAAAAYSNVRLLTFEEFQMLFAERWFTKYFVAEVGRATDPLIEYTEPINTRISKKADRLSADAQREFRKLRAEYEPLGTLCLLYGASAIGALQMMSPEIRVPVPELPLKERFGVQPDRVGQFLPQEILEATSYRALMISFIQESQTAIARFDAVFGERA